MYELYQAEWCPFSHRVRQRLTELGVDFIARQVPAEKADRTALVERTGAREIPVLVAGDEILAGPERIIPYLDRRHQRTPNSEKHRARDRDPEIAEEREEARREFP
ncbi:MAG: glutaredoxin family protein [Chloroflexota bacterium]